jgi:hypothetical protein
VWIPISGWRRKATGGNCRRGGAKWSGVGIEKGRGDTTNGIENPLVYKISAWLGLYVYVYMCVTRERGRRVDKENEMGCSSGCIDWQSVNLRAQDGSKRKRPFK